MTERLMGVETEYAFVAFRKDGSRADGHQTMSQIERLAEKYLPHLPARGQRGIFLQNASRFYRDFGGNDAHQEMTTPECPNPWDAVRYIVANEQILLGLTGQLLQEANDLHEALYFKHNVDYSGARTSWGTHESYLTRTPIRELPEHLLPHLVSRIVFTGAGGFNPLSPDIEFMLSPRVAHLTQAIAIGTEHSRPLFNTRDEPLCAEVYRRLHVISGESLCSHTGMWLRSATAALVVALTDGGVNPGRDVTLIDPVNAMRIFASDPTCRSTAPLAQGGNISAITIQRHFLKLAEAHVAADFMPPWAPQVCQHWRAMLDRLEQGAPDSVATILDWAIKFSLFTDRIQRSGMDWGDLRRARSTAKFERLRQQLFEIDIRYGQLGDRGVFAGLDRANVLHHRFPGVDNFPHAMINPPNLGRARLRGAAIQKLSGRNGRSCCDWMGVWDMEDRKFLDLSRPFEEAGQWKALLAQEEPKPPADTHETYLQMIDRCYGEGSFEEASQDILTLETRWTMLSPAQRDRLLRLKAWVQARRGHLDGIEILNQIQEGSATFIHSDYLYVLRFSGLAPREEFASCLQAALERFRASQPDAWPASFREHWGAYLVWCGKAAEAEPILQDAVRASPGGLRVCYRSRATLANAKRLLGKPDEARLLLEEARRQQQQQRFNGDLADFTLPNFAKLVSDSDPQAAVTLLSEAKLIQSRTRNRLGLIRTLLLDARLAPRGDMAPHGNEAILALSSEVPALATCKLFQKIMERWKVWSHNPGILENGDTFWGL